MTQLYPATILYRERGESFRMVVESFLVSAETEASASEQAIRIGSTILENEGELVELLRVVVGSPQVADPNSKEHRLRKV